MLIKSIIRLSPPEVIADFFMNAPAVAVLTMPCKRLSPPKATAIFFTNIRRRRLQIIFPRRHMTSGAEIFSIARVFSSTVAVARHRAARAAQTAESSHFTRQFW